MPEHHGVRHNDNLCANCYNVVVSLQTRDTSLSVWKCQLEHTFDWEDILRVKDSCAICYVNYRECSSRLTRRRENMQRGGSLNVRIHLREPGLYTLHYSFSGENVGTLSMVFAVATIGPEGKLEQMGVYNNRKKLFTYCSGQNCGPLWNPSSEITFTSRALRLSALLRGCIDHHNDCVNDKAVMPTRLLKIEDESDGVFNVRLIETRSLNGRLVRYATLSHCWGFDSEAQIKTTVDTYLKYIQSIPWMDLSQTFRDAITVCHAINLRYLWIDSLCIIQGDKDDWTREAALMADVFGASEVTIAGIHPFSPEKGLYLDSMAVPLIAKRKESSAISMVRWPAADYDELASSYLFKRGWIFQELLLSRRQVFFTPEQFYWQCRTCIVSEDGTEKSRRNLWPSPWVDGQLVWHRIISAYSIKDFTYRQDRLAALAGTVELYRSETQFSPLLGVWKESLAKDLGWVGAELGHQPRTSLIKGLPSWTWLFWDHEILFYSGNTGASVNEHDLECIEGSVTWTDKPMTSDIVGSKLELRGLLQTFKLDRVVYGDFAFLTVTCIDIKECYIKIDAIAMYMIPVADASRFTHAECLLLNCTSEHPIQITFLLIEETSSTGETRAFRRIGIGRLEQRTKSKIDIPWVFKGAPRVTIELV